ncbi:MAG TPA: tetratricopeptide repeat protein [Polyangiaceae bacterium]|nr:tetratricopeptide repeat protein [Polyangiaceae bacterium]
MSKRLEMLEKLAASGKADAFALYALAMEYRSAGRTEDSLRAFETLRAKDATYLPMYLMAGQLLQEMSRTDDARSWLEAGVELAASKGDAKAKNELLAAIAECD